MHGLVSLLPPPYDQKVKNIWDELEEVFGLTGIKVTPFPHFSWQIAEEYDFERLEAVLEDIAATTHPFPVLTSGLALFSGPKPVVYIPVVKSPFLMNFHATVWERIQETGEGISPYYSPENWMPHISLAYEDVNKENLPLVMGRLMLQNFVWEMWIDNISLIYEPTGSVGSLALNFKFL